MFAMFLTVTDECASYLFPAKELSGLLMATPLSKFLLDAEIVYGQGMVVGLVSSVEK